MRISRSGALAAMTVFILVASTTGCGDDGFRGSIDHSWVATYYVANLSSTHLLIETTGDLYECWSSTRMVRVDPGETVEVGYYDRFLGGPSEPDREFACMSVYRRPDTLLVCQRAPIRNDEWKSVGDTEFVSEITLTLTNAMLNLSGVENLCTRVTGTVRDAVTHQPLNRACVAYVPDDYSFVPWWCTEGSGEYTLIWPGAIPPGKLWVSCAGYTRVVLSTMPALEDLGDRHYGLDINMEKAP